MPSRARAVFFPSCLVLALVAGCGGSDSKSGASGGSASACDATAPAAGAANLTVCFSGPLTGTATQFDPDSECSPEIKAGDIFDVTYKSSLNGVPTLIEMSADKGPGTAKVDSRTGTATLAISQTTVQRNWSSVVAGATGTVTVNPDRSGSVNATVPERGYTTGVEVPGAPPLTVKGTFRCPPSSSS